MIVTLTMNPSLDRTARLSEPLAPGAVHRIAEVTVQPGGKGVNVARVVHDAGQPVLAVLPADGPMTDALTRAGLPFRALPAQAVRTNLAVTDPAGVTTKLNEPGARVDAAVLAALRDALLDAAAGARWVALSGSLPPGAPEDWYPSLVPALHARGARVVIDTSDAPLAATAAAPREQLPDLIKPNAEELGQLTGTDGTAIESAALAGDPGPALAAARTLVERGIGAVLATLGPAGAVLVTGDGAWVGTPPEVTVLSTVGAGDSSVAGYLLADVAGLDRPTALAWAMAHGSAAAALPGTTLPTPADVHPDRSLVRPAD